MVGEIQIILWWWSYKPAHFQRRSFCRESFYLSNINQDLLPLLLAFLVIQDNRWAFNFLFLQSWIFINQIRRAVSVKTCGFFNAQTTFAIPYFAHASYPLNLDGTAGRGTFGWGRIDSLLIRSSMSPIWTVRMRINSFPRSNSPFTDRISFCLQQYKSYFRWLRFLWIWKPWSDRLNIS